MLKHIYRKYYWILHLTCTTIFIYNIKYDLKSNKLYISPRTHRIISICSSSFVVAMFFFDVIYTLKTSTVITKIELIYMFETPFFVIVLIRFIIFIYGEQDKIMNVLNDLDFLDKQIMEYYVNKSKEQTYILIFLHVLMFANIISTIFSVYLYLIVSVTTIKFQCMHIILGYAISNFIFYIFISIVILLKNVDSFNEIIKMFARKESLVNYCDICKAPSRSYLLCRYHQLQSVLIYNLMLNVI